MKKIIILGIVVFLFACGKNVNKTIFMEKPEKIIDLDCMFLYSSIPNNDRLYIAAQDPVIFIYDINTFEQLGEIRHKGSGPGEFRDVSDMILVEDSLLVFKDYGNSRINWYTTSDKYIKSINNTSAFMLRNLNNDIFCIDTSGENNSLYSFKKIENDSLKYLFSFENVIPIDSRLSSYELFNDYIIVSYTTPQKGNTIIKLDYIGNKLDFNIDYKSIKPKYNNPYYSLGKDSKGELFIICSSEQKGKKRVMKAEGVEFDVAHNEGKFVYFNKLGKVKKQCSIEDCFIMMDVKEYKNSFYISDRYDARVLKYNTKTK